MLKIAVGLVLFVVSLLPTVYGIGVLGNLMPEAAAGVAFGLVGLFWLILMVMGTHIITEKLSRRWSK